jgi:hypothetical protein
MANFMPIEYPKKPLYIYMCDICDFVSCNKKDYNRHLLTRKHERLINANKKGISPHTKTYDLFKCECGKKYKHEPSLYKHKKKCSVVQKENSTNIAINEPTHQDKTDMTQKLVELIMSKNQEFMTELVTNLTHSNKDVVNKMMEIIPTIGSNYHITNTNSNNTTNNNQFNIQMFLKDHCKNAMNLTDFIDTLPITPETYDSTIDNGLTKTITNMITNGLSQLDILERPIHCTDASRKTLYVKEDNVWEKDDELTRMLLGIRKIAAKQRTLINIWKDVHDDWNTDDKMQTRFTSLVCNSITDIENEEKETNKIIRSVSKTVYLDNNVKTKYLE